MNELPSEIFKHWVHSYEEDTEDVEVYRPRGHDFPPSRGRTGFEIRKNGEFVQYDIAPTDGLQRVMGHWKAEGTDRIEVSLESPFRRSSILNIESCDKDILKIRKKGSMCPCSNP